MREELSSAEVHQLIGAADRLGVQRMAFTGGEPLLHPNLADFVRDASERGLRVYVESNATRLDDGNLQRLKDAGLQVLNLSLDSADPAQHNKLRGGDNFNKVVSAAHRAAAAGLDVRVYCTATKLTLTAALRLPELFTALAGRLGVLTFAYFSPLGRGRHNTDLIVNGLEWQEFCAAIEGLREAYEPRIGPIRYEPSTVSTQKIGTMQRELGYDIRCIARGHDYVYINPVGDVFGCAVSIGSLPPLGNIRQTSLRDIWLKASGWSVYHASGCNGCPAFIAASRDGKDFREADLPRGNALICPMTQYPKIEPWTYERSS